MTEQEWYACENLDSMWAFVHDSGASSRKLRLFACACCRLIPPYMDSAPDREGLEFTELDVDGKLVSHVFGHLEEDWDIRWYRRDGRNAGSRAVETYRDWFWDTQNSSKAEATEVSQLEADQGCERNLTSLFRDIVNPFHLVFIFKEWLTPDVLALSRAAYDERLLPTGHLDPARLAVLSDALEEAGCTDTAILTHLRSPGPHVRGCWALDLLLNKS